jgi:hypothetical protein
MSNDTRARSGRYGPRRPTTDAEIIALRERGWSTPNICRELRVGHPRVRRALAGLDIAPLTPTRRDIQRTENRLAILRLGDGTRTVSEIVAELGVSPSLVRRVVAQEGLSTLTDRLGPKPKPKAARPAPRPAKTVERPVPAASPRAPRTASDISPHSTVPTQITTRTCHACDLQIPEVAWPKHMAEVHKVVSRNQQQLSALDRYIAQIVPDPEPGRSPEPPCPICHRQPCEAPLPHARRIRDQAQHAARLARENEKKAA